MSFTDLICVFFYLILFIFWYCELNWKKKCQFLEQGDVWRSSWHSHLLHFICMFFVCSFTFLWVFLFSQVKNKAHYSDLKFDFGCKRTLVMNKFDFSAYVLKQTAVSKSYSAQRQKKIIPKTKQWAKITKLWHSKNTKILLIL